MKSLKSKGNFSSAKTYNDKRSQTNNHERTLTNWAAAVTDFYNYYQKLVACVAQIAPGPDSGPEGVKRMNIGQCPLSLILELICSMTEELKKLDQDMEQPDNAESPTICEHYKKLTVHTQVLNLLNQKAHDRLYLANSSNQ